MGAGLTSFIFNDSSNLAVNGAAAMIESFHKRFLEAIEELPPNFRAVLRLLSITQLSSSEIGQVLSIPAATAKTYFHRAKELLRSLLGPEFEHERDMEKP
jgi:DNA-directed RNA polymerase specialized sigma24 family protein